MSDDRWLRCRTCAGYYDQSDADQWMLDTGRDVEDGKDGNDLEYPFERHCPECVDKLEEHVRNEEEIDEDDDSNQKATSVVRSPQLRSIFFTK